MKKLLLLCLFSLPLSIQAQWYWQHFDGFDTEPSESILIEFPEDSMNAWQIGEPQKDIFSSASSPPNAIMTDTVNPYPANDTSSFYFKFTDEFNGWEIIAFQWLQKLDIDSGDGGMVEFSGDNGLTWQNAFDNPYVYNFYGYNEENVDTLPNGELGFVGSDNNWADIWLCYDLSWLSLSDSLRIRYTMMSDSIESDHEGWMIDNMFAGLTFFHTVGEVEQENYLEVYPNPTKGRVFINAQKKKTFHLIESMQLRDVKGKLLEEFGPSPTKFFIDLDHHPDGVYFLSINTNFESQTFKIILER